MEFRGRLPREDINNPPSSDLGELVTLLLGAVIGLVVIVALGVTLLDALVVRLPPDLEERWFGGMWDSVFDRLDPSGDDDASEGGVGGDAGDLNALLDRMAQRWPENPYRDLSVHVYDDSHENALALPGGCILVSSGLLEGVGSENEIAFVLSHELGHFRNRDHLRRMGRGLLVGLLWATLTGNAAGSAPELFADIQELASRSVDREAERAADRFGLELVIAEYGHVRGASAFFERALVSDSPALGGSGVLADYASTHPGTAERLDNMRRLALDQGWPSNGHLMPWPPKP